MKKESFPKNPFYPELQDIMREDLTEIEREVEGAIPFDGETGELSDSEYRTVREGIVKLTYRTQFIKLMSPNIHKLMSLPSAGQKLFWLVAGSISLEGKDKDYVYLGLEHCRAMAKSAGSNISQVTYYRGVDALVEAGIIAKSTRTNVFWLNISILFNGNFANLPRMREKDTIRRKLKAEGKQITYFEKES